jgi:hypothetical protein
LAIPPQKKLQMNILPNQIEPWILSLQQAKNLTGLPLVSLTIQTEPKLLKKSRSTGEPPRYPDGIVKTAKRTYMLAKMGSYENKVNNALEKMGAERDFEAQSLWNGKGERAGTFMARHTGTGKLYLAGFPQQATDGSIVSGKVEYACKATGQILNDEQVDELHKDFLPTSGGSPIAYNVIALENVKQITYCQQTADVSETVNA